MNPKYRDLNECVDIYKKADTSRKRDEAMDAIIGHLTHHVSAIVNIVKGTNRSCNPSIQKIMMSGMKRAVAIKAPESVSYFFQTMSRSMTVDDVKQMIYLQLLNLINSYKYAKITFLQYVTYLLPLRIASELVKMSKDAMNQFFMNSVYDSENNSNIDKILADKRTPSDILDDTAILHEFMTDEEIEFIQDIANGLDEETISKKHNIQQREIKHYRLHIRSKVKNYMNATKDL